ncbi:MAG: ABC transporter ATP-binding protein [Cellulosilyticaceae bacterium]
MSILSIKGVCYEAEHTKILENICLEIKQGECISLIGASGSGKSTLLKICADLIPLTKGTLAYKDKDYQAYNPLELRKKISYCVQLPYLFGDTVYDNLAFPFEVRKEKPNEEKMLEILEAFNLDKGFLHKHINSLSGGEKQRIAIARNLIYRPEILLLDEATSALDPDTANRVEAYIAELNQQGTTIIWITHNLEQSQGIFHKRVTMENGKIIAEEVFTR